MTLFYTPVSHAKTWQLYDQDKFLPWAKALAEKYGVSLFDFNLLKSRYSLFTDETSFSDDSHLSAEGAEIFSGVMADIIARHRTGEDVSSLFYTDYSEVHADSIYRKK